MSLTAAQIAENYNVFLSYIDKYITGVRADMLRQLYTDHADRIALMPASSKEFHHSAYPGGYVVHVINVIENALKLLSIWQEAGANISFTTEELVFAAINHDLGKIGDEDHEMYLPQDSEWHRKNQGALYKMNPLPPFMLVPDRSLFLLQQRGINVSLNEWLGIKLHDGLYDESNKAYLLSHSKDSKLRTNLPYLLHHADHLAAIVEYDQWKESTSVKSKPMIATAKTAKSSSQKDIADVFSQFFSPDN